MKVICLEVFDCIVVNKRYKLYKRRVQLLFIFFRQYYYLLYLRAIIFWQKASSGPSRIHPSQRPLCPGREVIFAKRRPDPNCESRAGSRVRFFCLAAIFFCTCDDFLVSSAAAAGCPLLTPIFTPQWLSYHSLNG